MSTNFTIVKWYLNFNQTGKILQSIFDYQTLTKSFIITLIVLTDFMFTEPNSFLIHSIRSVHARVWSVGWTSRPKSTRSGTFPNHTSHLGRATLQIFFSELFNSTYSISHTLKESEWSIQTYDTFENIENITT